MEATKIKKHKFKWNSSVNSYKKYFFESLATMLASGIDIRTVLRGLRKEQKSRDVQEMLDGMLVQVENGIPLWQVVAEQDLVPEHYLSIIRVGEESGNLSYNLQSVVQQIDRDKDFQNKVRSASTYPAMIFMVLLVVGLAIMILVIPRITSVYTSLNITLPAMTVFFINVGNFISNNTLLVLVAAILFVGTLSYLFFINAWFKRLLNQLLFYRPITRKMIQEMELSRFGYLLSSMLNSGVTFTEAMDLMVKATSINAYSKFYSYIADNIKDGQDLETIFDSYKNVEMVLPLYPRELLINGEKTGSLPNQALKIGEIYQKRNELTLKDLSTMIEPIMIFIVWIGVSIFAISVILPIYSLFGNFTNSVEGNNIQPAPTVTVTP